MIDALLIADLTTELPPTVRFQRLVHAIQMEFNCGAVGLLRCDGDSLRPVAVEGLAQETLGRRFVIASHPRLSAILASRKPVRFAPGSDLPDPYDGLLEQHQGKPLPVHDCMGVSLHINGTLWGALTLDALAGDVFNEGARDLLAALALTIETTLRVCRLEEENRSLRSNRSVQAGTTPSAASTDGEIIGQSPELTALLGETGVGKELFSRHVHQSSRRAKKPFIQVNCAALPESLAESELFGHIKGAFSGATLDRAGRIEAADGGTLFLDEVGELPLAVQAKLLRTLQNGEIQRLGADQPHRVDVRIIAATNRSLQERIREGHFRADLYHRLSVYPIQIPPLRERGQDVILLAGHFLEQSRIRLGFRALRLSPAAEVALLAYAWPGNVRELEHVISRAAIRAISHGADRNEIVTLEMDALDQDLQQPEQGNLLPSTSPLPTRLPLKAAIDAYQRQLIDAALRQHKGQWASAARMLDIDPSNLHKLARRLGIKP